jgi:hypothetical protein
MSTEGVTIVFFTDYSRTPQEIAVLEPNTDSLSSCIEHEKTPRVRWGSFIRVS